MRTSLETGTHCPGCCSPLRPAARQAGGQAAASARTVAGRAGGRPEVSGRTTARLLLAAGAALVVIAVIVFTVADWARIGPLGRCAILLGATVLVLTAPRVLVRRGLNATAESVAAIGLALTIADADLTLRLVGWHPSGGLAIAAAIAVLAGAWAAYGATVGLKGPKLAAIGLAQLPAPLAAVGLARLGGGPAVALAGPIAIALVLNSVADLALADLADRHGHRAEAAAGSVAAVGTWLCGVLTAAAWTGPGGRSWLAAALTAAAVVGILGPRRRLAALAGPAAAVSGALLAVGIAIPASWVLPAGWGLVALGHRAPRDRAPGLVAAGAAAVLAVTALLSVPVAIADLFPARWPWPAWSGPARYDRTGFGVWPGAQTAAVVLALAGLACLLVRRDRKSV